MTMKPAGHKCCEEKAGWGATQGPTDTGRRERSRQPPWPSLPEGTPDAEHPR